MKKLFWYLKQLLPLTNWSVYYEYDKLQVLHFYLTIKRMWFGKVLNGAVTVEVKDYYIGGKMPREEE